METPPDSMGPLPYDAPSAEGSPRPPGRDEREALEFVRGALLPSLRRRGHVALARSVEKAVADGRLAPLGRLPERTRRDLLEALESSLGRRGPSPRALVTLTSLAAQLPVPALEAGRHLASPAR